ncbi:MAG: hypothetical protein ACK5NT_07875 [Pyrinomonadaceae bacterium]
MHNTVQFEEGEYGKKAIVRSEWKSSYLELLKSHDIAELELNTGKGWRGSNVDFLRYFDTLQSIIIIDQRLKSLDPIHALVDLRECVLLTYGKHAVDFSVFPHLVSCSFDWINGSESLFETHSLRYLFVDCYSGRDSEIFKNLNQLNDLSILNSKLPDLNGIRNLVHLRRLRIGNLRDLSSLAFVQNFSRLTELEINQCKKITSIKEVFNLVNLQKLFLLEMGTIDTIEGIEKLKNLSEFIFYGATNIADGNLEPILALSMLKKISFMNRRHYTSKREEFDAYPGGKTLDSFS